LKWRRIATWLALGAVAFGVAAVLTLRSDWFREKVRVKLIREIGAATGARVEIGSFGYNWRKLEVELTGVVLHGSEQSSQPPFFLARKIRLTLGPATIFERRLDLRQLRVEQPEVHVYVATDGTTNLPRPATPLQGNVIEDLLRLKVGEAEIVEGRVELAFHKFYFAGRIAGLDTRLRYAAGPDRYESLLKIERIETGALPVVRLQGTLALESKRLSAHDLRVGIDAGGTRHAGGGTWVVVNGALQDFVHPSAAGTYTSELDIRDLPSATLPAGKLKLGGDWSWSPEDWRATSAVKAKDLDFVIAGRHAMVNSAESRCDVGRSGIRCTAVRAAMLGGSFAGSAAWLNWERLTISGAVEGEGVQRVRPLLDFLPAGWDGRASGNAHFEAAWSGGDLSGMVLGGKLQVIPAPGAWPLQGNIDFEWRQASAQVLFGPSTLDSPFTHVMFEGELDRLLKITASTSDIQDLEHGLRLGLQRDDISLPFRLDQGTAQASGTLHGPILNPAATAQVHVSNLIYRDVRFDEVEASASASANRLMLRNCRVRREGSTVSGSVSASLSEWGLTGGSAVEGDLSLKHADLGVLARTLGSPVSVVGTADINAQFRGTYDRPEATVQFDSPEIRWRSEKAERVKGTLRFHNDGREVVQADLTADTAKISGHGSYDHRTGDWSNGRLTFEAHISNLAFAKMEGLIAARPGLGGVLEAELSGAMRVTDGAAHPESISGRLTAEDVTLEGNPLGRAEVLVRPGQGRSAFELNAMLEGTRVIGFGTLGYDGDYLLEAKLAVPRLPLRLIRTLVSVPSPGVAHEALPVGGFIEGEATVHVPLARPEALTATASIANVQVRPTRDQLKDTQIDPSDLTLRNSGPIALELDHSGMRIKPAEFTARQTDLRLEGGYAFNSRTPWDLRLTGSADLAVLGSFRPDLSATGTAKLDAVLRGSAKDPQLSGRMTVSNASLFLRDVPSGIEHANGTVYFERNRANIEKLSGQIGAGSFEVSGFVALEAESSYRLQVKASNIRVRYPEGVSTTLDADLSLVGSSVRSLLSGTLTIARSGFNSRTDLAGMVAQSGSPVPLVVTDNEFLRNMQFDIRVRTTPNATLVSEYTQDIQTDADLRLRGSLVKPVLLGRIHVRQGLVQFFGSRYTVSRGELLFYSTATLAPSLDLDLETRIRGVTVYINVSGPLNRLKVNYRSEPPLQASEILALLTVGRAPTGQSTALPTAPGTGNPALTENSTNSLLGGALSGAVSARVERFFGASRIKIDPQMTGVDNIPQARITVEQSISRDVTLTLVTNLRQAQQQVVQIEWNLSREWSMVGVRDENGVLGIDFLFKKRFK
jgi:translocation and assembly module TamB